MEIRRRGLLVGFGAALAGLTGCAGSSAPGGVRGPPTANRPGSSPLRIVDFDTGVAEDGSLVVWVVMENRTDSRRSATLTVSIRAGDRRESQSVPVTIEARGRTTEEVTFDVSAEEFEADGDVSLRLE